MFAITFWGLAILISMAITLALLCRDMSKRVQTEEKLRAKLNSLSRDLTTVRIQLNRVEAEVESLHRVIVPDVEKE